MLKTYNNKPRHNVLAGSLIWQSLALQRHFNVHLNVVMQFDITLMHKILDV